MKPDILRRWPCSPRRHHRTRDDPGRIRGKDARSPPTSRLRPRLILRPAASTRSHRRGARRPCSAPRSTTPTFTSRRVRDESWALEDGIVKGRQRQHRPGCRARAGWRSDRAFAYSDEIVAWRCSRACSPWRATARASNGWLRLARHGHRSQPVPADRPRSVAVRRRQAARGRAPAGAAQRLGDHRAERPARGTGFAGMGGRIRSPSWST